MRHKKIMSRILLFLMFSVFACIVYFILVGISKNTPDKLAVHYIDVGYGNCALIEFPNGKNMLIDTGDEKAWQKVDSNLQNRRIMKIDVIVVSHNHPDHAGGLKKLLAQFKVGKVITIPETARSGMEISGYGEVKVNVISAGNKGNLNDASIVLKVAYKNKSFLFPSDIGNAICDVLVKEYSNEINCDVVSVPHHGKSSTLGFINAVSPELAVVSTGASQWGGPDEDILKSYEKQGAKVLRTDKIGTITIITDGLQLCY